MTIHIHKFIDRLRGAEARASKDFGMSMKEAKDLHADITKLLLELEHARTLANSKTTQDTVVTLEIDGGTFK